MHALIKTKTVREKPAQWLKGDPKRYMKNKNRLLTKACKTKRNDDLDAYRRTCKTSNAKLKEAIRNYHCNLIEENKSNPWTFWDAVKAMFPSKSKISSGYQQGNLKTKLTKEIGKYNSGNWILGIIWEYSHRVEVQVPLFFKLGMVIS